jgi:hypothetical protein
MMEVSGWWGAVWIGWAASGGNRASVGPLIGRRASGMHRVWHAPNLGDGSPMRPGPIAAYPPATALVPLPVGWSNRAVRSRLVRSPRPAIERVPRWRDQPRVSSESHDRHCPERRDVHGHDRRSGKRHPGLLADLLRTASWSLRGWTFPTSKRRRCTAAQSLVRRSTLG